MKVEDYLKKIKDSNVSYYLYVRENLKPNDYVKLNTGEITRSMNVSPIKGNKIYYANGDDCWFDVSAVRNFSQNIIDLIEVGDYVNGMKITNKFIDEETDNIELEFNNGSSYLYPKSWNYEARSKEYKIKSIVTKEQFSQMEYKVNKND